jgi:GDP-L-fucose synthase
MHVDDVAAACVALLERYDDPAPINIGVGEDVTIRELAETVAGVVGYEGVLEWDVSKPDGTPRKLLDVSRIHSLGWKARIGLREGIGSTYDWYRTHLTRAGQA